MLDIIEQSKAGDKITVNVKTKDGKTKSIDAVLKANVGESSYTLTENSKDSIQGGSGENGGGTFDFPFGE